MTWEHPALKFGGARKSSRLDHVRYISSAFNGVAHQHLRPSAESLRSKIKNFGIIDPVDSTVQESLRSFRTREIHVKSRERELQILCDAVDKTAEHLGRMDLPKIWEVRELQNQNNALYAAKIKLEEDLAAKAGYCGSVELREQEIRALYDGLLEKSGEKVVHGVSLEDFKYLSSAQSNLRAELFVLFDQNTKLTKRCEKMRAHL